jgi:hypothetical protein
VTRPATLRGEGCHRWRIVAFDLSLKIRFRDIGHADCLFGLMR